MHLAMRHLLKLATIFLRCIPAFFRSRNEQVIVELALRQQLATSKEKGRRPRITPADRGFWVLLSQVWPGARWLEACADRAAYRRVVGEQPSFDDEDVRPPGDPDPRGGVFG